MPKPETELRRAYTDAVNSINDCNKMFDRLGKALALETDPQRKNAITQLQRAITRSRDTLNQVANNIALLQGGAQ